VVGARFSSRRFRQGGIKTSYNRCSILTPVQRPNQIKSNKPKQYYQARLLDQQLIQDSENIKNTNAINQLVKETTLNKSKNNEICLYYGLPIFYTSFY
jgi:hypothetical protein